MSNRSTRCYLLLENQAVFADSMTYQVPAIHTWRKKTNEPVCKSKRLITYSLYAWMECISRSLLAYTERINSSINKRALERLPSTSVSANLGSKLQEDLSSFVGWFFCCGNCRPVSPVEEPEDKWRSHFSSSEMVSFCIKPPCNLFTPHWFMLYTLHYHTDYEFI